MTLNLSTLYGNVGPANSDIAAAVAAPSASTIATAVAGAVPTISAINTSVSTYASGFGNTYTLLTSGTMSGATSYTYSWSGTYKKLVIYSPSIYFTAAADNICVRFNGDSSASNYVSSYIYYNNYLSSPVGNYGYFYLTIGGNAAGSSSALRFSIDYPTNTNPKSVQIDGTSQGTAPISGQGYYLGSSITSVTFFGANSRGINGPVYVYGVN